MEDIKPYKNKQNSDSINNQIDINNRNNLYNKENIFNYNKNEKN